MSGTWIRRMALILLSVCLSAAAAGGAHGASSAQGGPDLDHLILLRYGTFDTRAGEPVIPAALRLEAYGPDESGYYIVQFTGIILPEWRAEVAAAGANILGYVPNNAFIVRMTRLQMAAVAALKPVQWIGIYHPAYRIAPELGTDGGGEVALVILTFADADVGYVRDRIEGWGARVIASSRNELAGKLRVVAERGLVPQIARLNGVMWIAPWVEPRLSNDVARGIMDVEDTVWNSQGIYGAGQIIAIADTGLDVGRNDASMSDDFEGRIVNAHCLGRSSPCDWSDPNGHGTHVAGSALGDGRNSGSNPGAHTYGGSFAGIAPEARLVFQSTLSQNGHLDGLPSDLNDLFQAAYDEGARIHSNSWGAPAAGLYTDNSFEADLFVWNHPDMVVLFAAGNEGIDQNHDGVIDRDSINSPGSAKNVVTVGASESERSTGGYNPGGPCRTWGNCWPFYSTNPIRDDALSNDRRGMAAFSSRGGVDGDRIKPDVVAPGTNIFSTRTHQDTMLMDAEGGAAGWTADPTWTITNTAAHGGSHSWTTGPYGNNAAISLASPVMDIRTEADTITFWTRYDLGSGDRGRVEYRDDADWQLCAETTGTQGNWIFMSCRISLPVNSSRQNFRIRFRLLSDQSGTGAGWFVDDIRVTPQGWGFQFQGNLPNEHYMYMGGTSMATPLVAGAAALVREYYTDRGHSASAALVKATLIGGADNPAPGQYGTGTTQEIPDGRPNDVAGWGRVNVQASLFPAVPQTVLYKDIANTRGLNVNQTHVYRYEVRDSSVPFRVTLVWTDYPGLPPNGSANITHDLDLTVRTPGGGIVYPNGRSDADRNNNVEDIFVDTAAVSTGIYVVTIRGHNIPDNGPQGYALVVRGGNLREMPQIAVTPPEYDDIGVILNQLSYPWEVMQDTSLATYERLQPFQTVFANCSQAAWSKGPAAATSLRQFVQNGGSFYASDWAYTYVQSAFPDYVSFRSSPRIGDAGYVNASIVDPGLANYLNPADPPSTISLNYNLSVWAVIDGVTSSTKVHLRGSFDTSAGQMVDKPLAVSFSPYSDSTGRVIYTTFHNEAQQNELEKKLLEYLVLIPSTSQLTAQAEQIVTSSGLEVRQTNINTINPGATSAPISYQVAVPARLMFVANWPGSALRLSVFRPDGTLYEALETAVPPLAVSVPAADAVPGAWKYQVTAISVPYANYPYVVVIGDDGPSGQIRKAYLPLLLRDHNTTPPPGWLPGAGITDRIVYDLSSSSAACSTLLAGTDSGAFRSTDGGGSWSFLAVGGLTTASTTVAFDSVTSPSADLTPAVAVCPANPNVVYLTRWGGGVFRSTDGGNTWQARNNGLADLWIYDLAVDPSDCDTVYAGANSAGVLKTTDAGASWQTRNAGLGNPNARSVAVVPGTAGRLYVGTTSGVYRSDNGAASWTGTGGMPAATARAIDVASNSADAVYVGLEGYGVYKSTNAGATWQSQNSGLGNLKTRALAVAPTNLQLVYAGLEDDGGVYRTLDGAGSWEAFSNGLASRTVKSLWLGSDGCNRLHAGTADGAWYLAQ